MPNRYPARQERQRRAIDHSSMAKRYAIAAAVVLVILLILAFVRF